MADEHGPMEPTPSDSTPPAQPDAPSTTPTETSAPAASEWGQPAPAEPKKGVNVWMIVAIAAIVLALIAGYGAYTYKSQVDDWEAAASETLAALQAAGIHVQSVVASSASDYEQQISNLKTELEQSQTEAGVTQGQLTQAQQDLADTQTELQNTQQQLDDANAQLADTQAQLDDANAKLEQVGQLVLPDGTYIGPVLAARTQPSPALVFQDGTAWRVAEVAPDATITSGGAPLTLEEFSALLQSTDPADVALANGNYKVKVKGGLVTSIQKSQQ
jgi:hypothetical protein